MKITIDSISGAFDFDCAPTERILRAGLADGSALPYECATGTCGTCRGRLIAGTVDIEWSEAPGYARLKREKGDVLLCQARPTSDCTLRVPAKVVRHANPETVPRHRTARIESVRRLVHDVLDFELALSAPMTFEAGQFVVLENPAIAGGRAYSMVNFEPGTSRLRIVIKKFPGGRFSQWLFGGDPAGTELAVFGPLGRATFHPEEGKNILCVAGGSGIAGMLAICEHAVRADYLKDHTAQVFFGVRTLADAFYMEELSRLVGRAGDNLNVTLALSHEPVLAEVHPQFPSIRLAGGMVGDVMIQAMAGQFANIVAFTAGPPIMVDSVLKHLTHEAKIPRAFIRYDKFA
ncbi:MAG TPA: 2Fe-2S iron-sulfur cluster binding domain-containing protein [Hyphomicrobiaceae bacterium]|nr:2Fe-2S iron-sulfur cluster binding domain-containing protein [Hyphomicrobiaceae bacterium]